MSKFNSEEILWFVKYFYEWHTNKWSATHIIKHLPAFLEEYYLISHSPFHLQNYLSLNELGLITFKMEIYLT